MSADSWFAAIVHQSSHAIMGTDLHGKIGSWNATSERLFGYSSAEAIGRVVDDLIVPPQRKHEKLEALRRINRGESYHCPETVRLHKDGHLVDVSLSIFPIRDEAGAVVGTGNIIRDVSIDQRVDQARRARDATDLCDILLQTLSGITVELASVRALPCVTPEVCSRLALVADRADRVVRDLLSEDPLLHGQKPAGPPDIAADLTRLAEELVPHHIEKVVNLPAEHVQVDLDEPVVEAFIYVAREALLNAVRHSSASRIAVDFRRTPVEDVLAVQDDGGGFNPEAGRDRMGIPLMRIRIERVGGRLDILSIPGMGTTVRASLQR